MKIKKNDIYKIELYEEGKNISDHNKKLVETLEIKGLEIIDAIISAGMPDVYLTPGKKHNRREEIAFKIKLFETFVVSDKDNKLSFDFGKKEYLDSTEVGAINYWIGMILITVLGKKKYQYDFLVHLTKLQKFSKHIPLKKRAYLSQKGKIIFKSPDLIAINCRMDRYGVFESKGYSQYNQKAMEDGYKLTAKGPKLSSSKKK